MQKSPGPTSRVKHASPALLRGVFEKYASVEIEDEKFIKSDDFIRKFLGLYATDDYNVKSVKILGGMIDTSKDGLISFPEFLAFEKLLCTPDALYFMAFQLFDTSGNGIVSFDEFEQIISHTTLQQLIPFDLNGNFVRMYFGDQKDRLVTYGEFCEFLRDYHYNYAVEAFERFDKEHLASISRDDFITIMKTIKFHLLTKKVAAKLEQLIPEGERVTFQYFTALNALLNNMELVKKIYLQASKGDLKREITKDEFLFAGQRMCQLTPLEASILFQLCELVHQSPTIIYSDFLELASEHYYKKVNQRILDIRVVASADERNLLIEFLESLYRFVLGSVAGGMEAVCLYPMDLVKTRMQLQRLGSRCMKPPDFYKNNYDCMRKALKFEGVTGLYRGIFPQILAVSLGKALKLSINDWVRDKFTNRKGQIRTSAEIFAGACAGATNVIVTNPLEIIKIRIQIAGTLTKHYTRVRALDTVRSLGFQGLYKGVGACLLRDVPFSAIFFPVYAHLKIKFQDKNGYNSPMSLLAAGVLATLPGAPLSMPFDVIKTRLQVDPKPGQTPYMGVRDAFFKIYREEGFRTFWRGTRVVKPSQFGMTLLLYEVLQRLFYVDFAGSRPTGSEATIMITNVNQMQSRNPDHVGGFALALPIISGIESKFGLAFPKTEPGPGPGLEVVME